MKNNITSESLENLHKQIQEDGIQKVVVGAVIKQDDKVLLVRRIADNFMGGLVEIPSGGVDPDEDYITALVREIKEETNLDITHIQKYLEHFDYTSGSGKNARQLNFLIEAGGNIKLSPDEHDMHYWLDPSEAEYKELNISSNTRDTIKKVY